jgi:beta-glucosidase/6-phospho-beta-glucosidase/beta-galactosidase
MALMRFFEMGQARVAAKLDIKHGVVQASRYYTFLVKAVVFRLQLDRAVLEHYQALLKQVRAHGMRLLQTLLHHSMPKWAILYGGWTIPYFVEISK